MEFFYLWCLLITHIWVWAGVITIALVHFFIYPDAVKAHCAWAHVAKTYYVKNEFDLIFLLPYRYSHIGNRWLFCLVLIFIPIPDSNIFVLLYFYSIHVHLQSIVPCRYLFAVRKWIFVPTPMTFIFRLSANQALNGESNTKSIVITFSFNHSFVDSTVRTYLCLSVHVFQ